MIMENRLPVIGLEPCEDSDESEILEWCKQNGIKVYVMTEPKWHNDETPVEPYYEFEQGKTRAVVAAVIVSVLLWLIPLTLAAWWLW